MKALVKQLQKQQNANGGAQYYSSDNTCYSNSDSSSCNDYNNKKSECSSQNDCKWQPTTSYWSRGKVPGSVWFVWILMNIFFILFILTVIGYGTLIKSSSIINLGITFFILDVISRYIGFMMDLYGYKFLLPIVFITGGILLIGGGWLIARWRKKLLGEIK